MRILSVVRIEVFSMYGYDYMKKIVLRRADLNEHVIAERDFKYLYPSDFEDLNLLNLQGGEHASVSTPSETATEGAGRSTTGSQSQQLSASESAFAEEPMQTTCQMEESPHLPRKPPSPDRAWNKTLPAAQGDAQSWISDLARQTDARLSFNELLDTPINFSNFIMHRLNVDILTLDLLAGPTYELMRGSCTSLTELEYHLEEVYKA
nr:hypothetical protein [Tanacetum cinerariifolium]